MSIIRLNAYIEIFEDRDVQLRHINCVRFSFTERGGMDRSRDEWRHDNI